MAEPKSPAPQAPGAHQFRADIEGLRAIAVLLVVGAHYAVPGLAGGFVGVDVFFVISGYLISALLVREVEGSGRIALWRFYANRLRRLLPALLTMVCLSALAARYVLPLSQQPAQGQAAAMASGWLSNFYFALADVDYFAAHNEHNAFLHSWSLGVEEQFYLLWPPLVLLCWTWARGQWRRQCAAAAALALLSLALCWAWTRGAQPMLAYYLMPARAWQFAAGALIWLALRQRVPTPQQALRVQWLGVLLLLASLRCLGPTTAYPGLWALLPTLATCAFLWAGATPAPARAMAWLSSRPLLGLGRLSYAWYLWHWPVLVLAQELVPVQGSWGGSTMALGISLLAALATHHLVEQPLRFGRLAQLRPGWQIAAALALMLLCAALTWGWARSAQQQLDRAAAAQDAYTQAVRDMPAFYRDRCDDWHRSDALKPCRYGNAATGQKVVLWGDSIGTQWFPALQQLFDLQQWELIVLVKSACPIVDETLFYQRIGREYRECSVWRERALAWLAQQRVQYLFMGSALYPQLSAAQWREGTARILARLAPDVGAVYVIEPNPSLAFHGPDCLRAQPPHSCHSSAQNLQRTQQVQALQQAVAAQPRAHWLATAALVCPNGRCAAQQPGPDGQETVVFRDQQHLTARFAAQASESFRVQMGPLAPPAPPALPR